MSTAWHLPCLVAVGTGIRATAALIVRSARPCRSARRSHNDWDGRALDGKPFGALSVCPGPARPGRPGARSVLTRSSSSPSAAGWMSSRFSFPNGPASRSNAAMTACRRPVALHVLGVDLELKVPRQPPSEALGVCVYHFVALLDLGAGRRSPGADIDTRPSQRQAASAPGCGSRSLASVNP
jgi:hypothetical protein